jgi:hypothetical protein
MKAYVFPGHAQFTGMGKIYMKILPAAELFEKANEILGFCESII